jgi:hypothetical protein
MCRRRDAYNFSGLSRTSFTRLPWLRWRVDLTPWQIVRYPASPRGPVRLEAQDTALSRR